jgi:hypothetical protein
MKKLTLALLLCVSISFVSNGAPLSIHRSANDSVYVEIVGDTVKIWDKQIEENCCSKFIHEVTFNHDSITVIEKDTSTNYCRCPCYFDLVTTILGLNTGSYHVFVYRTYAFTGYDSLYFIDSTSFVYGGISFIEPKIKSYQSVCYHPVVVDEINNRLPEDFSLSQNYPNPFNPVTVIRYQLPIRNWVTLKVYDILGQEVATLVDGMQDAGFKYIEFSIDGTSRNEKRTMNLSSGVYIYKLMAGEFSQVRKMLLVK